MEFAQSEPVLATTFEKSAAEDSSEFDRAEVPIEQEQDPPNAEPAQVAANSWSPAIVVGEAAAVARPLIEVATRIKPNARILRLPREDEPEKKTS